MIQGDRTLPRHPATVPIARLTALTLSFRMQRKDVLGFLVSPANDALSPCMGESFCFYALMVGAQLPRNCTVRCDCDASRHIGEMYRCPEWDPTLNCPTLDGPLVCCPFLLGILSGHALLPLLETREVSGLSWPDWVCCEKSVPAWLFLCSWMPGLGLEPSSFSVEAQHTELLVAVVRPCCY